MKKGFGLFLFVFFIFFSCPLIFSESKADENLILKRNINWINAKKLCKDKMPTSKEQLEKLIIKYIQFIEPGKYYFWIDELYSDARYTKIILSIIEEKKPIKYELLERDEKKSKKLDILCEK